MKRFILLFSVLLAFFGCEKDPTINSLPTITTGTSSNISYTTATVSFSIANNNAIEEAGIVWDTKGTMNSISNFVESSVGVGAHTISLSSLSSGTTIYYKAYAKDGYGNYIYGEVKSFITKKIVLPVVTTSDLSDILEFTATCGGTITLGSFSITERGVCYNTTGSPTINNYTITTGTGSGTYTSKLTGLTPNTKYYVRAYAIDSYDNCVYGAAKSFTTIQQETGTFTDARDNVTYNWVKIGNQVWMAENLRATKYNSGTAIPNVTVNTTWANLTTGAYCYYNNSSSYSATYGCLYNWYAVNTGNLAPTGWHVPTYAEWSALSNYLGDEGGYLKSTTGWSSPNTGATNLTGFKAMPGGYRLISFYNISNYGRWWSSTVYETDYAWFRQLIYSSSGLGLGYGSKSCGFSVRCVRDN
jgi:uncharacterized protein (TIGR02145 family)